MNSRHKPAHRQPQIVPQPQFPHHFSTSFCFSFTFRVLSPMRPLDTSHSPASPLFPLDTRKQGVPPCPEPRRASPDMTIRSILGSLFKGRLLGFLEPLNLSTFELLNTPSLRALSVSVGRFSLHGFALLATRHSPLATKPNHSRTCRPFARNPNYSRTYATPPRVGGLKYASKII